MKRLCPNFKLWVYSTEDAGVIGDGKIRLLKTIEELGSLREAATHLQVSYRKAWGDLRKAEACLRMKLVEKSRGGARGGQTTLTPAGKRIIKAYTQFRQKADKGIEQAFEAFLEDIEP